MTDSKAHPLTAHVAIIGGGPAGLMAAEVLADAGVSVAVYDGMPSVGRKFLLAGVGGMNITHAEALEPFLGRYGTRRPQLEALIRNFDPAALQAWIHGLGIETFVGTSGRVFPKEMKAAPLLRAWLARLKAAGVVFHVRHRWFGWADDGALRFATPAGEIAVHAAASVLALGGGSWQKLGSDGAWAPLLAARGVDIAPLQPSNCGFDVNWTPFLVDKFAGSPLKSIALSFTPQNGETVHKRGEFVVTKHGVEGSLIYAFSAGLRDAIAANGSATIHLDLVPDRDLERVIREVSAPRGSRSLSSHLQSKVGIEGVKAGLLRECVSKEDFNDPLKLAHAIKSLPIKLVAARPLDEAISTAGGVTFHALDEHLMLNALPGAFCAGEMLDWEAPTGGYLLTACFATGRAAGQGVLDWLASQP
ncbi:TIGR03862 family flavoprotein [Andreprevotia chitinilytica]|uniref:TIGR03862 family flavoprotein n=1 Tax=Andreprevotia chitinilytica TaxID=396808 RepID=UPI000556B4DB|nr:TIGR03862 family flavoprotein [Andreprevotia chitinilytica]